MVLLNPVDEGEVDLKEFEASVEGLIESYTVCPVREDSYDNTLEALWEQDRRHWD